jgi:hypothetical protein
MRYRDVSLPLLIFFFSLNVQSKELYEFYNGIRQMGMGGAYTAVVNDETALILNPAALGKLRDGYLTVFDPEIHIDNKAASAINNNNYDVFANTHAQDLIDTVKQFPDEHYHSSAYLFPSYVGPNFGIGLLGTYNYDAQYNSAGNDYDLRYRNDYAFIMGFDFRFFDGIIKLGFNGKYINRVEADENIKAASANNVHWTDLVGEGSGFASDAGLIITAPVIFLPSIAAVWHDIGDTCYGHSGMFYSGRPEPECTRQTIDVGTSITPIIGKYSRMQLTADFEDVRSMASEKDKLRRLHAGLEFNFYDKLFIRGGMNQRYWTAGLEMDWTIFQLQFASWGEDVGTYPDHQEDRRYAAKFSIRF